jgi:tRNA(fMet)-specific endonuclease VapC
VTLRFLLDTNVLSEPLKPIPQEALLHRLEEHHEEVATAAPVWHELVYGCRRLPPSRRRATLERYLDEALAGLIVLPYDTAAAARHAEERARLEASGRTAPFVDAQIAAIALVHRLVLVTHNVADFRRFAGLEIEDWSRPA